MPLSWNEIKSRAMAFSRQWHDAAHEKQQAIPFWIDFFEVFGISNRRVASFEHAVTRHGGGQGYIDLFWPGQMLVEHKSRGKPLAPAFEQAMGYFPGLAERDLPHTLVLCDFAQFRVIDLQQRREISCLKGRRLTHEPQALAVGRQLLTASGFSPTVSVSPPHNPWAPAAPPGP